MIQLDYPSKVVKDPTDTALRDDLAAILAATRPRVVYTHNPADKHETHIAVVVPVIQAIRALPRGLRPERVHGCEVWRDLDWMPDAEKVAHDLSGHEHLAAALNGIFDSQIAGGKRYDLATLGRRRANATFFESHATDERRCARLRHGSHAADPGRHARHGGLRRRFHRSLSRRCRGASSASDSEAECSVFSISVLQCVRVTSMTRLPSHRTLKR